MYIFYVQSKTDGVNGFKTKIKENKVCRKLICVKNREINAV